MVNIVPKVNKVTIFDDNVIVLDIVNFKVLAIIPLRETNWDVLVYELTGLDEY